MKKTIIRLLIKFGIKIKLDPNSSIYLQILEDKNDYKSAYILCNKLKTTSIQLSKLENLLSKSKHQPV